MDPSAEDSTLLEGIVELDEKYFGGKPRHKKGGQPRHGKATTKQPILSATTTKFQDGCLHFST